MGHEEQLKSLGVELPPAPKPGGSYVPAVRCGELLYVSGMVPVVGGVPTHKGAIGAELSVEDGQAAARQCVDNALAVVRAELGTLDALKRVIYVQGFVRTAADAEDCHIVLNGASDRLVELLGADGQHTRAAVGVYTLPLGVPIEVQFVFLAG